MVTKIKKQIDNSKRKGDFKKRQNNRIQKKHRQNDIEKAEFVDKRELINDKKKNKKALARKEGRQKKPEHGGAADEDKEMNEDDDEASDDAELEKELEEDLEAKNHDLLDETVFNKFATGELDLPEDEADLLDMSDDDVNDAAGDDSELEAYYEELGIDVTEMQAKRAQKTEEAVYKK